MDLMGLLPLNDEKQLIEKINLSEKHECQMPKEKDYLENYIPGNGYGARLHRWFTRKRVVSPDHYYAKTCLKSTTAIRYEVTRHLQEHPWMIHPFSPIKNCWCILMCIYLLFALTVTPFVEAFYYHEWIGVVIFLILFDFILLIDTSMNFFVGYFDDRTKTVYLDPKIVSTQYAKGFLIFDLLSGFPIELFDLMLTGKIHWYCSAFNMLKILRFFNFLQYVNRIHKAWHLSYHKVKIFEIAVVVGMVTHWGACLVYLVPLIVHDLYPPVNITASKSWILTEDFISRDTKLKKYILCQNRATISLIHSYHFLDVSTLEDMSINLLLAIIGKLGFIFLLAGFFQLISTFHSHDKERLRALHQLQEYMTYKELPNSTQKRMLVYNNYWYKKNFYRDSQILSQISTPLREALVFHTYLKLLETVDFFKYLPRQAIMQLVYYIKREIYLLNDTIVKAGTPGTALFFIGSGTVSVYTALGKEVCHLEDGAYFGEIALVMENEHRVATVVAIETCEILLVPREAFQSVIAPFPNLLNRLQKVALERLEKTLFLEEIYKLEDSHPRYINISNIRGKKRPG